MNLITWLALGGFIGWLASLAMRTGGTQAVLVNVAAGTMGALLAVWVLSPMVDFGTVNDATFSLASLGASVSGAIVLLLIVNLFRQRGAH
jgi:uncharacterized membrane protein YeaQ/YmgE (transglycosylase-associated protein family)